MGKISGKMKKNMGKRKKTRYVCIYSGGKGKKKQKNASSLELVSHSVCGPLNHCDKVKDNLVLSKFYSFILFSASSVAMRHTSMLWRGPSTYVIKESVVHR